MLFSLPFGWAQHTQAEQKAVISGKQVYFTAFAKARACLEMPKGSEIRISS
jgi:hypothetical protein